VASILILYPSGLKSSSAADELPVRFLIVSPPVGVAGFYADRPIAVAPCPREKWFCSGEKYWRPGPAPQVRRSIFRTCAISDVVLGSISAWSSRRISWEDGMTWKTPKIVELPVGMEINMYACAARK